MTHGIRSNGEFCWINMLTPNPTEACAFFASLLGWTYDEIPGMGPGALGAKVFVPLQDIPGIGRFCGIDSQQGVKFYVLEYAAR